MLGVVRLALRQPLRPPPPRPAPRLPRPPRPHRHAPPRALASPRHDAPAARASSRRRPSMAAGARRYPPSYRQPRGPGAIKAAETDARAAAPTSPPRVASATTARRRILEEHRLGARWFHRIRILEEHRRAHPRAMLTHPTPNNEMGDAHGSLAHRIPRAPQRSYAESMSGRAVVEGVQGTDKVVEGGGALTKWWRGYIADPPPGLGGVPGGSRLEKESYCRCRGRRIEQRSRGQQQHDTGRRSRQGVGGAVSDEGGVRG